MGSGGYKISDQGATHFVSFAVVGWVDVFIQKEYSDIIKKQFKALPGKERPDLLWMVDYK